MAVCFFLGQTAGGQAKLLLEVEALSPDAITLRFSGIPEGALTNTHLLFIEAPGIEWISSEASLAMSGGEPVSGGPQLFSANARSQSIAGDHGDYMRMEFDFVLDATTPGSDTSFTLTAPDDIFDVAAVGQGDYLQLYWGYEGGGTAQTQPFGTFQSDAVLALAHLPEPGTGSLLLLGGLGLAFRRRERRRLNACPAGR